MIKFVQKGIFKKLFDFDGFPNRLCDEDSPGVRPYPADWALDSPWRQSQPLRALPAQTDVAARLHHHLLHVLHADDALQGLGHLNDLPLPNLLPLAVLVWVLLSDLSQVGVILNVEKAEGSKQSAQHENPFENPILILKDLNRLLMFL